MKDTINRSMVEIALEMYAKIKANALFVNRDIIDDPSFWEKYSKKCRIILIGRKTEERESLEERCFIGLPTVELTRVDGIKIAIMIALSSGIVKIGDLIVCLTGAKDIGILDTMMIIKIGKESEIISTSGIFDLPENVKPEVFETVLNIALELAVEGRSGKPVGTIFVIGDHEKVLSLSRQMVMNPFRGYPEEERNILDKKLRETIKEFSSIDGAFIIREDGIVIAAGRHLTASLEEELPHGLGSRHMAAAGITLVSNAISIVISESTGTVRIFKNGKMITSIERVAKLRSQTFYNQE